VTARPIRERTFRGDHFDWGLQRGLLLRGSLVVPEPGGLPRSFVADCRAAACELHPPAVREFEGLLRGGGFDPEAMEAHYFARLQSRLGGCTMFAVRAECRDGGRGPIVGRNYDWAVQDLRWCELHRYEPGEGLRRIGYTHHWAGCCDLLNEAGLYLAIASLPAEPVRQPGVEWTILTDAIIGGCSTTAQVVRLCAGVRHLRTMSYLLADAAGDVAVVEAGPGGVIVRRAEEGVVAATNVARGGETLSRPERGGSAPVVWEPRRPPPHGLQRAERRYEHAVRLLAREAPSVSEEAVRRILSDHEAPICTGDHAEPDGARWATIWSGVCEPAAGRFLIAPGLPCRHDYRAFGL
jgi:hypothetical protein